MRGEAFFHGHDLFTHHHFRYCRGDSLATDFFSGRPLYGSHAHDQEDPRYVLRIFEEDKTYAIVSHSLCDLVDVYRDVFDYLFGESAEGEPLYD